MCMHESSDVYMLLQGCAQMTFDGSRLVDTACCGYAYLQPAGLAALRQRYQQEVAHNARVRLGGCHCGSAGPSQVGMAQRSRASSCAGMSAPAVGVELLVCAPLQSAFGTDEGGGVGVAPGGEDEEDPGSAAEPTFARRFRRLSSVLLDAEEAIIRQQDQQQQGGADSGHLSPACSRAGSSRSGSPGPGAASAQPASPLARMQQTMRALTSRLMPSSLPVLLPAGAMGAGGQELTPTASWAGSSGRASGRPTALAAGRHATASPASACDCAADGEQKLVHVLRCISVGRPGTGSPTAGLSHSAGAGAVLGRQAGNRLTPFSDGLTEASLQRQQPAARADHGVTTAGHACASTPQRPCPALVLPAATGTQSQPATPGDSQALGGGLQPSHSQRRAWTAAYPGGTQPSRTRHRRRLTLDLHGLANLRLDMQQPAVAAAFAIAANPSPGGRGSAAAAGGGRSLAGSPAGLAEGGLCEAPRPASCDAELLLPVRTLRFDEQEAGGGASEGGLEAPDSSGERCARCFLAHTHYCLLCIVPSLLPTSFTASTLLADFQWLVLNACA